MNRYLISFLSLREGVFFSLTVRRSVMYQKERTPEVSLVFLFFPPSGNDAPPFVCWRTPRWAPFPSWKRVLETRRCRSRAIRVSFPPSTGIHACFICFFLFFICQTRDPPSGLPRSSFFQQEGLLIFDGSRLGPIVRGSGESGPYKKKAFFCSSNTFFSRFSPRIKTGLHLLVPVVIRRRL